MKLKKITRLGSGSYGIVYDAEPEDATLVPIDYEKFAVKKNFISPILNGTIGSLRELDILVKTSKHPFCIKLIYALFNNPFIEDLSPLTIDLVPDKVYFVFEKGDLDGLDFINCRKSSAEEKMVFMIQILSAIEFLHSRGLYHCDIKPQNIICFLSEPLFKLTDYGLTRYYTIQENYDARTCTLLYRAPEIMLNKHYDYKVDIWSFGCIIYELFTQGTLFCGDDEKEYLKSVISKCPISKDDYRLTKQIYNISKRATKFFNFEPLKDVKLINLLSNMLEVDPDKRFTASMCLNHCYFDEYREYINIIRSRFDINDSGLWISKPINKFLYINCNFRDNGMDIFYNIYLQRYESPINEWYTHRILFHAMEMFDRYLMLNKNNYDLLIIINTLLFMSCKFFRILQHEIGPEYFCIGLDPESKYIDMIKKFEEYVVRECFRFVIYNETLFEIADIYLSDDIIERLINVIRLKKYKSGTDLKLIWKKEKELLKS
ncbi:MAG: serine/threonine-protein kinase [Candidatus Micrarchaeaceae archaeon]